MNIKSKINSFPLCQNGVLQVAELTKAVEIEKEATEVVKTDWFVRVIVRSEANNFPLCRNGVLQPVAELIKACRTSEKGAAEVAKTVRQGL